MWLCYLIAQERKLPKVNGTFSIWRERNSEIRQTMTAVKLNAQRASIGAQLSDEEKIELNDQAKTMLNIPNPPVEVTTQESMESNQETHTPTEPTPIPPKESTPPTTDEDSALIEQLVADITVLFLQYRNAPLEGRSVPQKFDRSGAGNCRLKAARTALSQVQKNLDKILDIDNYNTLLYATAIAVAGPVRDTKKKERPKPKETSLD